MNLNWPPELAGSHVTEPKNARVTSRAKDESLTRLFSRDSSNVRQCLADSPLIDYLPRQASNPAAKFVPDDSKRLMQRHLVAANSGEGRQERIGQA